MNERLRKVLVAAAGLVLIAAGGGAHAAAGKVIYAFGQVQAFDAGGKGRALSRGEEVNAGETLATANGRAQVRFVDGGFVALQPNTRFKIDQYRYAGIEDGSERSLFDLVKGGIRFVTGAIGHKNKENYKIKTAVATIGIRGSGGRADMCVAGSCPGLKDGLHLTGNQDTLTLTNQTGTHDVEPGQTFYVECEVCRIIQIEEAPEAHVDVTREKEKQDFVAGEQRDELKGTSCTVTNTCGGGSTVAPAGQRIKFAFNFFNSAAEIESEAFDGEADGTPDNRITLSGGKVTAFTQKTVSSPCPTGCTFDSAGASVAESGSNSAFGASWVRWTGPWTVTGFSNVSSSVGDFHVITSNDVTPGASVPTGGFATYSTLAGGTSPTRNDSPTIVGTHSLSVEVDFSISQVVMASVNGSFPDGVNYRASGSGNLDSDRTGGFFSMSGTCSGGPCSTGTFIFGGSPFAFLGPSAGAIMGSYHFKSSPSGVTAISATYLLTP